MLLSVVRFIQNKHLAVGKLPSVINLSEVVGKVGGAKWGIDKLSLRGLISCAVLLVFLAVNILGGLTVHRLPTFFLGVVEAIAGVVRLALQARQTTGLKFPEVLVLKGFLRCQDI